MTQAIFVENHDTGTPLIGRFLGPRKNRLNKNRPIGGVCMV